MLRLRLCLLFFAACVASPVRSAVIVDDTWADGNRTTTDLPVDCAWYGHTGGSLVVMPGLMTGTASETSSRSWFTYFTIDPAQPIQIAEGEQLKITLQFTPNSVAASNSNRGLRIGLFDYSGGTRTTNDVGSSTAIVGTGVRGYMLSINFSPEFSGAPIQILTRSNIADVNLMGTTSIYASLGSGGGAAGDPGFQSGGLYTLEYIVARQTNSSAIDITARFSDNAGWSISYTLTDASAEALSRFDTFVVRWERPVQTATSVTFTRFKVEAGPPSPPPPPPFRITSIERPAEDTFKLTWDSVVGKSYEVQVSDDLTPESWVPIAVVTADATSASHTDFGVTVIPQRYYRLIELP